jgi:hypothetical protein
MALIICKDCQKQFSTDVKRCPHCGAKVKKETKRWSRKKICMIIGGIVFLPPLLGIKNEPQPIDPITQAQYICKGMVKKSLHDPDSAEFDTPNFYAAGVDNKNIYRVVVTLRAKNGFNALRKMAVDCRLVRSPKGNWLPISMEEIH